MAAPTSFSDLSTTAASNYPSGSDNVFPSLDDTLRVHAACLASIMANSGNSWVSPYLAAAGALVWNEAGATVDARFEGDTDQNLLFLDASADFIGIGTNAPQTKVHISDATTSTLRLTSASGAINLDMTCDATTVSVGSPNGAPLLLKTSGVERARFDTSGNLIHTVTGTAPTLTVNATMSFELTSNTSLKIVVRGSDGVTRSTSLTLS